VQISSITLVIKEHVEVATHGQLLVLLPLMLAWQVTPLELMDSRSRCVILRSWNMEGDFQNNHYHHFETHDDDDFTDFE
jgi:hypothetical protein